MSGIEKNTRQEERDMSEVNEQEVEVDYKEQQRVAREIKKEEERLAREAKKEEERLAREAKKEEERLAREAKKEEERLAREAKKEEERLAREAKKEAERLLKEERRLEREREKEQRIKEREETKRKKEEEREEAKRKKDEEQRRKEEEAAKEKEKKEKSQMRIGSFFKKAKPAVVSIPPTTSPSVSEYHTFFLPFYRKDTCLWAAPRATSGEHQKKIDSLINSGTTVPIQSRVRSDYSIVTATTYREGNKSQKPPLKYTKFYENVRPPTMATCSLSLIIPRDDPFNTELSGFDYSYDSDIEWEEEEGEDIDDIDDEDEEEDEDDDDGMDGFLDEEDTPTEARKVAVLTPVVKLRGEPGLVSVELFGGVFKPHMGASFEITQTKNVHAAPSTEINTILPRKKAKTVILDNTDLEIVQKVVHDSEFTLGTMVDLIKKDLGTKYPKNTIENTIRHHGKKEGKKWVFVL